MSASEFDEVVRRLSSIEQLVANKRDWQQALFLENINFQGKLTDAARTLIKYQFTVGKQLRHYVAPNGDRFHFRANETDELTDCNWEVVKFCNTTGEVHYLESQCYSDHAPLPWQIEMIQEGGLGYWKLIDPVEDWPIMTEELYGNDGTLVQQGTGAEIQAYSDFVYDQDIAFRFIYDSTEASNDSYIDLHNWANVDWSDSDGFTVQMKTNFEEDNGITGYNHLFTLKNAANEHIFTIAIWLTNSFAQYPEIFYKLEDGTTGTWRNPGAGNGAGIYHGGQEEFLTFTYENATGFIGWHWWGSERREHVQIAPAGTKLALTEADHSWIGGPTKTMPGRYGHVAVYKKYKDPATIRARHLALDCPPQQPMSTSSKYEYTHKVNLSHNDMRSNDNRGNTGVNGNAWATFTDYFGAGPEDPFGPGAFYFEWNAHFWYRECPQMYLHVDPTHIGLTPHGFLWNPGATGDSTTGYINNALVTTPPWGDRYSGIGGFERWYGVLIEGGAVYLAKQETAGVANWYSSDPVNFDMTPVFTFPGGFRFHMTFRNSRHSGTRWNHINTGQDPWVMSPPVFNDITGKWEK